MSDRASLPHRMYLPGLDLMLKEAARELGHIDFEHQIQLKKVEQSANSQNLKHSIRETLRVAHRERRQPYVDLLNQLSTQQRGRSFAA